MESWGVLAIFAVVLVAAVSAVPELDFPEVVRERSSSRIVSGWEASLGQFPHQMSLRMVSPVGAVSSCGATIIHEEWGLTAAHCTAGRISFVLRAGVVNLTTPAIIFETTEFYNYPDYDNSRPSVVQPHDIGILNLGRKLIFSDYVKPIRIQRSASKAENYSGRQLIASGWGRTWTNGAAPENMNWVFLSGNSNEECLAAYPGSQIVVDSTICASYYNVTSQSTCQGDSGGPLTVIDDDGQLSQIGVTSFVSGTGCHTPFPAGFIRPGYYHEWFAEVSGINFDWEYSPAESSEESSPESSEQSSEESSESNSSEQDSSEEVEEQEECLNEDDFRVHFVN